jgi:hypothetical protein
MRGRLGKKERRLELLHRKRAQAAATWPPAPQTLPKAIPDSLEAETGV